MAKFHWKVRVLSPKLIVWKQKEAVWRAIKAYSSLKVLLLPSLTICLYMELLVLVPASVDNKSLITQSITKQELRKYQPSQNPTYQIDSLKKEINEKLISEEDSLVDKFLSCPRIKLSNSQTLILDGVESGIFVLEIAQQLRHKNADFPDIYFTLLDAAGITPTLILNQNAKAKERGSWVIFKIWRSEAAKVVHTAQGGAVYASPRNLVKATNLSVSKVNQFLHSKPSYRNFTLALRNFKHLKAFARFEKEIWCMDLAYVDKLAREKNGVNYLVVRQDLFDRNVDAKGLKTKGSKETVRSFLSMITKKNRHKKIWVDKGIDFAGKIKTMQSWRKTNLLYNEWDQGCICWTYNTIPRKYTLPLDGRQWIKVISQNDSTCYNTNF